MKMLTFSKRCTKEILRDPINLGFGLGFPLVLLFLLSSLQANIPVPYRVRLVVYDIVFCHVDRKRPGKRLPAEVVHHAAYRT